MHAAKQVYKDIRPAKILITGTDPNTIVVKFGGLGLGGWNIPGQDYRC